MSYLNLLLMRKLQKFMAPEFKHYWSTSLLSRKWNSMKQRCYSIEHPAYKYYGGRGIVVCKEWLYDRKAFIQWALIHGYKLGLQIDRKNNDGNYTPDNCRFVTRQVNMKNRGKRKLHFSRKPIHKSNFKLTLTNQ